MAYCKECAARRKLLMEAAFEGRLAAAVGHAVKGAAEMAGVKPKTAVAETEATAPEVDAPGAATIASEVEMQAN